MIDVGGEILYLMFLGMMIDVGGHSVVYWIVALYGVYFMICGLLEDYLMKDGEIALCS